MTGGVGEQREGRDLIGMFLQEYHDGVWRMTSEIVQIDAAMASVEGYIQVLRVVVYDVLRGGCCPGG